MLGVGACAIAVVALCRRALRTPTPRDGRPQLTRQNAYRTLPGLRDDPPPSYSEAVRAPKEHIGGAPPRAEGDGATPAFALELLKAQSSDRENVFVSPCPSRRRSRWRSPARRPEPPRGGSTEGRSGYRRPGGGIDAARCTRAPM